jgi:iturin family lipopeptide synthetase A
MSESERELAGIAVVGLALRFPGAADPEQLWRDLASGVDSVSRWSDEELAGAGVPEALRRNPRYVAARGVLAGAERFDAAFFGLTPRQAELMDPQHRVFLECAWEALETAGYGERPPEARVGVFAGTGFNSYLVEVLGRSAERLAGSEAFQLFLGNDKDFVPTRVSYTLDLRGPSVAVNSACSSSLAAVHLACQSLIGYQCDMALAGGVTIRVPQERGYLYEPEGIHSPDGRTRPFDAAGQGMVDGNGAGVVLLKRYDDAMADGDLIWAVIRGSAMNNDGAGKLGFTAPGVDGQAEVVAEALTVAGVEPDTVTYVEAHGTGTPLGDPVEVEALRQVLVPRGRRRPCALGSIKSNIGHLDSAAGVAGLIKAVLALRHRQIPPTVHFERPNLRLGLEQGPFYVNRELVPWEPDNVPRRAGVSSFGIGGTNVHVVLEEAPPLAPSGLARAWQLLVLSARTREALAESAQRLARHLEERPGMSLADAAYTLQVGRRRYEHRMAVVARDPLEAARRLTGVEPGALSGERGSEPRVAFLFPGQGAQAAGMGAELYRDEPRFREEVDRCAEILHPLLGRDLREVLDRSSSADLTRSDLSQPALFVVELALARLWMSWGIEPAALLGHSLGEYVAACLAGVFSLEDALALVAARGRLVQGTEPGAMLGVDLPPGRLEPWLAAGLCLAAVNGPSRCVLSGRAEAVEAAERVLVAEGVSCRRLPSAHAYHSDLLEPVLGRFEAEVRRVRLEAPRIPCISNLTGGWASSQDYRDPRYWAGHLRGTVRFSEGLETLFSDPDILLLEVGPGRTLTGLALRHPSRPRFVAALSSLPHRRDGGSESAHLLSSLGRLWARGARVDWTAFHCGHGPRRRVVLPVHPLDRKRFWLDPEPQPAGAGEAGAEQRLPAREPDPSRWFWVPSWRRLALTPRPAALAGSRVSIVGEGLGLGAELARLLRERGCTVEELPAGGAPAVSPEASPDLVVHLGSVLNVAEPADPLAELDRVQDLGLYSLLSLARLLGGHGREAPVRIAAVTNRLLEVSGESVVRPERGTLLGAVQVIPVEYPGLRCAAVDLDFAAGSGEELRQTAERLLAFLAADPRETGSQAPIYALRGPWAWVQDLEPAPLSAPAGEPPLRERGHYLVTGGLGGMGLYIAEHLAAAVPGVRLVLTGRSGLPEDQDAWLADHGADDPVSERILRVRALAAAGAEVLVHRADVADAGRMAEVLAEARARFGRLHGVVHCAGMADYAGMIHRRSRVETETVLAPKVRGTLVLAHLLREQGLDFLVLCSSLGSVLVHQKYGQVGYSAANAFLDVVPAAWGSGLGRVITINWDDWRQVGMTVEAQERWAGLRSLPGFSFFIQETLLPSEGVEVFRRALSHGLPRVLVSTRDLRVLIREDAAVAQAYREAASREAVRAAARPESAGAFTAPRNPLERLLVEVWREVLGISDLGVDDSFHELGGDSLAGLTLARRLERRLGVAVGVAELLDCGTVAALAARLAERHPELADDPSPRRLPAAVAQEAGEASGPDGLEDRDHPLSFAQQRLWFVEQLRKGEATYNMAVAARLAGPLDTPALERSVDSLLRRHAALRSFFPEEAGVPRQRVAPPSPFRLAVEPYGGPDPEADPEGLRRWVSEAAREPFDLAVGPLFRFRLWRLADGDHLLLMAIHHIVSDGTSVSLAAAEIAECYRAFKAGTEPRLPELPLQYPDHCARERERLASGTFEQRIGSWVERFARAPELELPAARQGAERRSAAGRSLFFELDRELSRALEEAARKEGATLFMVLLAAYEIALWSFSGQTDLVLGTSISTRDEATSDLVGLFVNQLVLRTDLAGAATVREALQRVRRAALAAYELKEVPFDLLVQRLRVSREAGRTPLVRTNFVFQAAADAGFALDGLDVETLPVDRGTSKFDLLLDMERRRGRLAGFLEYSTELFEHLTAEAVLGRFESVLAALAADLGLALGDLRARLAALHPGMEERPAAERGPGRVRRRSVPLARQDEAAGASPTT